MHIWELEFGAWSLVFTQKAPSPLGLLCCGASHPPQRLADLRFATRIESRISGLSFRLRRHFSWGHTDFQSVVTIFITNCIL